MNARLILVLLVVCFTNLFAQKGKDNIKLLKDEFKWTKGSILLDNGEELIGQVKYDDHNGLLSYHDGNASRSVNALDVIRFEFFDVQQQLQRVFYSLEDRDPQTYKPEYLFFELLRDYKTFAILLRTSRVEVTQHTMSSGGLNAAGGYSPGGTISRFGISQSQTVCILNSNGEVLPYFECVYTEDGRRSLISGEDVKIKNTMLDDELLRQFISETNYSKLQRYAEENKLNFKKINDFKKILEYYDSLILD